MKESIIPLVMNTIYVNDKIKEICENPKNKDFKTKVFNGENMINEFMINK